MSGRLDTLAVALARPMRRREALATAAGVAGAALLGLEVEPADASHCVERYHAESCDWCCEDQTCCPTGTGTFQCLQSPAVCCVSGGGCNGETNVCCSAPGALNSACCKPEATCCEFSNPEVPGTKNVTCCPPHTDCVSTRGCMLKCPAGHSRCGEACCPRGAVCADGACTCPDGAVSCGDRCCGPDQICRWDGQCACPEGTTACGESGCCGAGEPCRPDGTCGRCETGETPCGDACCAPGMVCGDDGTCACPPGRFQCAEQLCCAAGDSCCGESPTECCPSPRSCAREILPGDVAARPGAEWVCCDAGSVVPLAGAQLCCPPGHVRQPEGGLSTRGGLCCPQDRVCNGDCCANEGLFEYTCCGDGCCGPMNHGWVCEGGRCISPHERARDDQPPKPEPGPPAKPAPPPGTAPNPPARAKLGASLRADAQGDVRVPLSCPGPTPCAGQVVLVAGVTARPRSLAASLALAAAGQRRTVLGRSRFRLEARETDAVELRLSKSGLAHLRRRESLRVHAEITTGSGPALRRVVSKAVTLRAPRTRRRSRT